MRSRELLARALLLSGLVVLVWSGVHPRDRFTWWLEVAPVLIGVPIIVMLRDRFPLSTLAWILVWIHSVILMVGGHYTYAEVPLFDRIRDAFGLARNHYDRVGHFAQGFVPAILAREILLRKTPLRRGGWLFVLVVSVCLAISALYELIEWSAAAMTGEAADAFLGTQGDPWDTQKDMALALVGAIAAQLMLARVHDRSTEALPRARPLSEA